MKKRNQMVQCDENSRDKPTVLPTPAEENVKQGAEIDEESRPPSNPDKGEHRGNFQGGFKYEHAEEGRKEGPLR